MMSGDWLQVAVAGLVIVFVLYAVFRSGTTNPVGTGSLQRQLNTIGSEMLTLKGKVDGCALTSEVNELRGEIRAMEGRVASSADVIAVQGQIAALRVEISSAVKAADRTEAAVNRMEDHFLGRGIRGS